MSKSRYPNYISIALALSICGSSLFAVTDVCMDDDGKSYFDSQKKGWFWGEGCSQKIKKPKIDENTTKKQEPNVLKSTSENNTTKQYKMSPKTVNIPWEIIDQITRDEVKKIEKEARDIAVTYPTYENVLEHKKLQKYISDKAMDFTNQSLTVVKQDFEMAQWASSFKIRNSVQIEEGQKETKDQTKELFYKYKDNMLIIAVTAENCGYCQKQIPVLQRLEKEYGIQYDTYDYAKFITFAKNMKVERTPDLFLLFRINANDKNPKIVRIATGFHGVQDLIDGVKIGLKTLNKIEVKDEK